MYNGFILFYFSSLDRLLLSIYFGRLEISIESIYFKKAGKDIPMLSIIDDGHGMTHQDVVRMTYFGHKQPDADDPNRIGRFGVGFKVRLFNIPSQIAIQILLDVTS